MPNDLYPEPDKDAVEGNDTMPPAKETDETEEGATALLPKSILGGKDFQPGEEVVLTIKKVYGDEVEVAYASEKPSKETKPTMPADEEIDMMDKAGSAPPAGGMGMANL